MIDALSRGAPVMLEPHELEPDSELLPKLSRSYSLAVLTNIASLTSVLRMENLFVGTPRPPRPASPREFSPPCRSSP